MKSSSNSILPGVALYNVYVVINEYIYILTLGRLFFLIIHLINVSLYRVNRFYESYVFLILEICSSFSFWCMLPAKEKHTDSDGWICIYTFHQMVSISINDFPLFKFLGFFFTKNSCISSLLVFDFLVPLFSIDFQN